MKKFGFLVLTLMVVLTGALFFGCGAETVSFSQPSQNIKVDESFTPVVESNSNYILSIADETVAKILTDGKTVLGIDAGQTKIYAITENGKVTAMTLNVAYDKESLTTPTGLSFNVSTRTLSWIGVPNAFSYEVTIKNGENEKSVLVYANKFCFDDFSTLTYVENAQYEFSVMANASQSSKAYTNSNSSEKLVYTQLPSLEGLSYDISTNEIIFEYNIFNLSDDIEFKMDILQGSAQIDSTTVESSELINGIARKAFNPTNAGEYIVRVYASGTGFSSSIVSEIIIVKFATPILTGEGDQLDVDYADDATLTLIKTVDNVSAQIESLNFSALTGGKSLSLKAVVSRDSENETYYISSEKEWTITKLNGITGLTMSASGNSAVALSWDKVYQESEYKIYVNGELTTPSQTLTSGRKLVATLNNLSAGSKQIVIVVEKEQTETDFYINSDNSQEMTVVKLSAPILTYNETSDLFVLSAASFDIGAKLEFNATYLGEAYTVVGGVGIEYITQNFAVAGLTIDSAGTCEITTRIIKTSSENTLYLPSDQVEVDIVKLGQPDVSSQYQDGVLVLSWNEISDAEAYFVEIDNLTDTNDNTATNSVISSLNGIISVQILNLKNGDSYKIGVKAGGVNAGIDQYLLNSDAEEINISKLSAPQVSVSSKTTNSATLSWPAVPGANYYDIYLYDQTKLRTMSLSTTIYGMSAVGEYPITVIAVQTNDSSVLPCSEISGVNSIVLTKIGAVSNVMYYTDMVNLEEISYISATSVLGATGYYCVIVKDVGGTAQSVTLDSYSFGFGGKVVFNLGNTQTFFNIAGEYSVSIYATNSDARAIQSSPAQLTLTKLSAPTSLGTNAQSTEITWQYSGNITPTGFDIYIDGVKATDYQFRDQSNNICMAYDVSTFSTGVYSIRIIAKGNGSTTIDSEAYNAQFFKKAYLDSPTNLTFVKENDTENSRFVLTFDTVENADFYRVCVVTPTGDVSSFDVEVSANETITTYIERSFFPAGLKLTLYILACVDDDEVLYCNSLSPSQSELVEKIYIYKSLDIATLTILNEQTISLTGKQAIINSTTYTNTTYTLPSLTSGEQLSFTVRPYVNQIDAVQGDTFYMAGDWGTFTITKLTTPTVSVEANQITWSNISYTGIGSYTAVIKFYGIDGALVSTKEITGITYRALTLQEIKETILDGNEEILENFAGDYTIQITAIPTIPTQNIYLTSASSSEKNFAITGSMLNSYAVGSITADGNLTLTIAKNNNEFMNSIALTISNDSKTAILILGLDGSLTVTQDQFSSFDLSDFVVTQDDDNVYLTLNVYDKVSAGLIDISWTINGTSYVTNASSAQILQATKLAVPTFSTSVSEDGNKLIISPAPLSTYPSHVVSFAKYGEETLDFETVDNTKVLTIPYSWTTTSSIEIYATSSTTGFIKSNAGTVSMIKYAKPTGLALENTGDNTYLTWTAVENGASYIVYIQQGDATIKRTVITSEMSNTLELTSDIISSGSAILSVTRLGDGTTYFNSDLAQFEATKLPNEILLTNTNGVLGWDISPVTQSQLSALRLKINSVYETLSAGATGYALTSYQGSLAIQLKLIGDVSQNIISSDYGVDYNFYKYLQPTTLNISNGEFVFGVEGDSQLSENVLRIKIGDASYSYVQQASIPYIDEFYETAFLSGTAYAYAIGGESIMINQTEYMTLTSELSTSKSFVRISTTVSNEEAYITEDILNEQRACFNWNWTESGNITTRTVIITIIPASPLTDNILVDGWTKTLDGSGRIVAFTKSYTPNAVYDGSTSTQISLSFEIPTFATGMAYYIYGQKSGNQADNSTLAGIMTKQVTYYETAVTTLSLNNGVLNWQSTANASTYSIQYTGDAVGYINLINGLSTSYETSAIFADSSLDKSYTFYLIAVGNVSATKPEVIPQAIYQYVLSNKQATGITAVKPHTVGELDIANGALIWVNTSGNTYGEGATLEFVFSTTAGVEIQRVLIPASAFEDGYPTTTVLDTYMSNYASLTYGQTYLIKYRELGETAYLNGEYRSLTNNKAFDTSYFKIAPTVSNIAISSTNLSWSSVTVEVSDFDIVYYELYFTTADRIFLGTTTEDTSISLIDLQSLPVFYNAIEDINDITGMFIVVKGDSQYIISGHNSQTIRARGITGNIAMTVEDGIIKWAYVANADSYDIRDFSNNVETIYNVKLVGENYQVTVGGEIYTATTITLSGGMYYWDISNDTHFTQGITHALKIRYNPIVNENEYSIPGTYSAFELIINKLAVPTTSVINGVVSWGAIANATSYKGAIYYYNSNDEIITTQVTTLNGTTWLVDVQDNSQAYIKISVIAIGTTSSVNGVYYLNSQEILQTCQYVQNTITNIAFADDILSWVDSAPSNTYQVIVRGYVDGNLISEKSVLTTNRSYDLSTLKLSSTATITYVASVKIAGNSTSLGGIEVNKINENNIEFKVMPTVSNIYVSAGQICWTAVDGTLQYKVTFDCDDGKDYVYIIGLQGESWVVVSKTVNGVVLVDSCELSFADGIFTFWASGVPENYSTKINVACVGKVVGDTIFISSAVTELSSKIQKAISTSLTISYNDDMLRWLPEIVGYSYNIKIYDSDGENRVFQTVIGNSLDLAQFELESGEYTVYIQRVTSSSMLKSNYAEFNITIA